MFSTKLNLIVMSTRPRRWTKNLLVFIPFILNGSLNDKDMLIVSLFTFTVFTMLSGAIYIINDLQDLEVDSKDELKKHKPIASGKLPTGVAAPAAITLAFAAATSSFYINPPLSLFAISYIAYFCIYGFYLKNIPVINTLVVASGFPLRIVGGALAIGYLPHYGVYVVALALGLIFVTWQKNMGVNR